MYPIKNPRVDLKFKEPYDGYLHEGLDMSVHGTWGNEDLGEPIMCIYNGKVIFSSYSKNGYGPIIVIESNTPNGKRWHRYCHLQDRIFTSGSVKRGDRIAGMGNGGNTTASHLHFDVFHKKPPHWRFFSRDTDEWFEDPMILINSDIIDEPMDDYLPGLLKDQLSLDVTAPEGDVRGRVGEITDKLRRIDDYEKRIKKLEKEVAFSAGEAAKFEEELRLSLQTGTRLEKEIAEVRREVLNRDNMVSDLSNEVQLLKTTLDPDTKIVIEREEYERLTKKKVLDRFTAWEMIKEMFKRTWKGVWKR